MKKLRKKAKLRSLSWALSLLKYAHLCLLWTRREVSSVARWVTFDNLTYPPRIIIILLLKPTLSSWMLAVKSSTVYLILSGVSSRLTLMMRLPRFYPLLLLLGLSSQRSYLWESNRDQVYTSICRIPPFVTSTNPTVTNSARFSLMTPIWEIIRSKITSTR